MFASSEVGAQRVGIIQSLLVTARLHGVNAYTYLLDVLQRISIHPANRALTHPADVEVAVHRRAPSL